MNVLGLDPATENYGYSVVSFEKDNFGQFNFSLKNAGTFSKIGNFPDNDTDVDNNPVGVYMTKMLQNHAEISALIDLHDIIHICIERFQTRGKFKQSLAELNNLSIGVAITTAFQKSIPHTLITPVNWKVAIKQNIDLKAVYANIKQEIKEKKLDKKIQSKLLNDIPHITDATILALFGMSINLELSRLHFIDHPLLVIKISDYLLSKYC